MADAADPLDAARDLLVGARLEPAGRLDSGERSSVHRVRAVGSDGSRHALVVKSYRTAGEGWARETAALSVVAAGVRAPRMVASGAKPPLLITEDLGTGPSVATALLGADPEVATQAVVGWAQAVATLHVATRDARAVFRAALDERQGDLPISESRIGVGLDDAVRLLDRECASLGVRVPADALDELRGLARRLGGSTTAALTPSDTCPDNNVHTDAGLVLTDFEDAQWRHIAWDVAYLRVPWPTCWCAWAIPAAVSERAIDAYRTVAVTGFPEVAGEAFDRDLAAAVTGWALLSTSWALDAALGSDPPLPPQRPAPTRRAVILHRLDRASRGAELPALAELCGALADGLRARWGDVPLAYARAFRRAQ